MHRLWIVLILVFGASTVFAGDEPIKVKEVVVSATKIEEAIEETTSSVLVIDRETIEASGKEFVADLLKDIPEINIVQNGGAGKLAQAFIRGGEPAQVLVLIDGVKIKSTTTGTFDFAGITANDIERIEIVKGPQSTIYGSEAMAGVINIITRKGGGDTRADLVLEGGSFESHKASVTVLGSINILDYRVTGSYLETDGISIARDGDEKDGYKNATVSAKLGLRPSDTVNLEFTGRYYYDRSDLDGYDYVLRQSEDVLDFVQHGHHYVASVKASLYLFDIWEQSVTFSVVEDTLRTRDPVTSWNNYDIITGMDTLEWQHNLYISDNVTVTAGYENRLEKGENIGTFTKAIRNHAFYLNNKLSLLEDNLHLNAGVRYDDHETFGIQNTYRVGGVFNIRQADVRIKANYGTGFRAPTFNELFWPADPVWGGGGNPDLEPEKTRSWEAGIEKNMFNRKMLLQLTYFHQKYRNLISGWPPVNIGKAEARGIEAGASMKATDNVALTAFYTYVDTEDKDTGQRLTRRPIDKLNVTVDYSNGPVSLMASYLYVGKAYDDTARRNLSPYSLVNLSGGYVINKNVKFFGRIDNLFDEDYETAGGYNTPGISAYAGVKVSI